MDYSPPGSSVHGILHARILEWVAISFSRGSSQPRDQTHVSCIGRQILYRWASREAPLYTWFPLILAFLLGILTVWFISFITCSQTSSFSSIILVNVTSLCWLYTEGCAVIIWLCIFMLYLSSFRAGRQGQNSIPRLTHSWAQTLSHSAKQNGRETLSTQQQVAHSE